MKVSQKDQQLQEKNQHISALSIAPKVNKVKLSKKILIILSAIVLILITVFVYKNAVQRINEIQIKISEVNKHMKGQSDQFQKKIDTLQQQLKQKQHQISEIAQELEARKSESLKKVKDQQQKNLQQKQEKNPQKKQQKKQQQKQQKKQQQKTVAKNPFTVELNYQSRKQALPINPLMRNTESKGIFDVLYKDEGTRQLRMQFTQQRINFANANSHFQSANLIKYNLIANEQMLKQAITENEKEWLRLQAKFKISTVKEELPFCIISASFNNNARFRIEANLNSIFSQNYTNFKHVIINDASTDGSNEVYRNYYNFYKIDHQRYVYIENKNRVTALQNIYMAAINTCSKDSMVLIVDGDDEIIGRNTLKLFNWGFQTRKVGVLYSNFYFYKQGNFFKEGPTEDYLQNQKKNNLYRNVPMKFSHLRGARAQLFHQIKVEDLQYNGKFFQINADLALFYPMLELSCGRVSKIQNQFNILYIWDTGINDYTKRIPEHGTYDQIRAQKKYQCYRQFDQKMKK